MTGSQFKEQLQEEYNEMVASVKIYGGFYIVRYETGNLSQAKAVVKKNNTDINNKNWYETYKINKTIKANNNVVTTMIWGSQWDATMRWMQTSSNSEVVKYVTDSTGKGNYYGTNGNKPIATGSNNAYAVNNIYDMAGNVYEWTMETLDRVPRGGCYNYSFITGDSYPVSKRGNASAHASNEYYGTRVALYVMPK